MTGLLTEQQKKKFEDMILYFTFRPWYVIDDNGRVYMKNKETGAEFHWYQACLQLIYPQALKEIKGGQVDFFDVDTDALSTMALGIQHPIDYLYENMYLKILDRNTEEIEAQEI